jgi:hypothetical protein
MIIGFGAIFNLYLVQLLIPRETGRNTALTRVVLAIILAGSIFTLDWLVNANSFQVGTTPFAITTFDGLFKIDTLRVGMELFITFLACTILVAQSPIFFHIKSTTSFSFS